MLIPIARRFAQAHQRAPASALHGSLDWIFGGKINRKVGFPFPSRSSVSQPRSAMYKEASQEYGQAAIRFYCGGASSRNRTGTINDREILSLLRLPIPPWTRGESQKLSHEYGLHGKPKRFLARTPAWTGCRRVQTAWITPFELATSTDYFRWITRLGWRQ